MKMWSVMDLTEEIRAKLEKLEELFARGATPGERAAAGAARDRLAKKLKISQEDEIELQYSLPDGWAVRIFVALCRKRGVKPFLYPQRRRTKVIVRVQPDVFDMTVGAEFRTSHAELVAYFKDTVDHLIADAMKSDGDDENIKTGLIYRQEKGQRDAGPVGLAIAAGDAAQNTNQIRPSDGIRQAKHHILTLL